VLALIALRKPARAIFNQGTIQIMMRGTNAVIASPEISWDIGSAYDLFISLWVIHRPDNFGLRPSWAAGVRSRLPLPLREVMEESQKFLFIPLNWIHNLPDPKNAQTVLDSLKALSPEDRLPSLTINGSENPETNAFYEFLISLEGKQRLTAQIEQRIMDYHTSIRGRGLPKGLAQAVFSAWSDRKSFGENYYNALDTYVQNFFLEEETRITPALEQSLAEAQALSNEQDFLSLIEKLSAGVRIDWSSDADRVILAPSFWAAPLIFLDSQHALPRIIVYGKRPIGTSLVPGEQVPEELLNGLKAMADPTRLRILKFLIQESWTPSELAKALRLRPPTVIHHLNILRLAGFVLVTISANAERRYAARTDGILDTARHIHSFLLEN
jgi:DNA-binding transcriptional ArsR family regulator